MYHIQIYFHYCNKLQQIFSLQICLNQKMFLMYMCLLLLEIHFKKDMKKIMFPSFSRLMEFTRKLHGCWCISRGWRISYFDENGMGLGVKVNGATYLLMKPWTTHVTKRYFSYLENMDNLWLISQNCYEYKVNQIFVKLFEIFRKWKY